MPTGSFDALREELTAIDAILSRTHGKTLRDDALRERLRMLFQTWLSSVRPMIEPSLKNRRDFFKLSGELESIAKLTSKVKRTEEYRKRIRRAIGLANGLILYLPPTGVPTRFPRATGAEELFVSGIPDLPLRLVPRPLIGWKSKIEGFLSRYPFDKSVFVMVRYRQRNDGIIGKLKALLAANSFNGILASEHNLTGDLYNPVACLLCCSRGIAIFDKPERNQVFNPNVAYELGMMHLLSRECLILKHKSLKTLHADILMKLYVEYDDQVTLESAARNWLSQNE